MKSIVMTVLLSLVSGAGAAKSLGVVGATFPVAELSFLAFIEARLKVLEDQGELEALQARWTQTVASNANRPTPLNLPRTVKTKSHFYTPSIVLGQPITDSLGRVLFEKGTTVKPLERLPSYAPCWLFFNADDAPQLRWASQQRSRCANPKLILTQGAVSVAENELQAAIYFDQAGRITNQLNLKAVPAIVTRAGNQLKITEVAIRETGDER